MEKKKHFEDFLALCGTYFSAPSVETIRGVLALADEKLAGIKRYDGTDMVMHSVGAAEIVIREIGLGRNSTVATLLHDVVQKDLMSLDEAGEMYGEQCRSILKGLCNISEVDAKVSNEQAGNFRDLIVSYSTDPRVILIKLADRLEVMRSLQIFPREKQQKKSWESLNLYAQIAHKLGLYGIKSELEDISLSYLDPESYNYIRRRLEESAPERQRIVSEFLEPVEKRLKAEGYKYAIKSRTKSIYSIWSKMRKMKVSYDEVYDIFALRIIVDCQREQEKMLCWGVYSIVTDFYQPNPDRLRDWISIPKSNGYESLHTTVLTPDRHWIEVQIRSERMDLVAERGIAAHWRYKGVNSSGIGSEEWLSKLRELMEETQGANIAEKFDAKLSFEEIFVFTPKGDLHKLPEGATVLDFAFAIHSGLGSTCTGGKVNNRNVPIKEQLKNGDIVEIFTSKNQHPKADWLNAVVTGKARNKIRAYLREEQARESLLGREELERKIRNWKLGMTIDDAVTQLCKYYKCKTGTEFYALVAQEKVDMAEVKEVLTGARETGQTAAKPRVVQSRTAKDDEHGEELVIDESIRGMEYKFARCCNPIFGDEVFGFVTVGSGITIHRRTCPNAARLTEQYPYRVLPARWRGTGSSSGMFLASLKVVADNIPGMVGGINEVITRDMKLNIRSMNLSQAGGQLAGVINVEVGSSNVVETLIHSLLRVKGIQRVFRVNNL